MIFIVFGLFHFVSAQMSNPALRDELLNMEKVDQEERKKCMTGDADSQAQCFVKLAETVDSANTKRLEELFDRFGFPNKKMVGAEAVQAFMILLQHTTTDKLRERSVKPITKAFTAKELTPQDYANFIDRLRLHQGKGQLYGSGFESKDGKLVLSKTDDIGNLEKRRRRIGLPPLSEYIQMLKDMYHLEVQVPVLR